MASTFLVKPWQTQIISKASSALKRKKIKSKNLIVEFQTWWPAVRKIFGCQENLLEVSPSPSHRQHSCASLCGRTHGMRRTGAESSAQSQVQGNNWQRDQIRFHLGFGTDQGEVAALSFVISVKVIWGALGGHTCSDQTLSSASAGNFKGASRCVPGHEQVCEHLYVLRSRVLLCLFYSSVFEMPISKCTWNILLSFSEGKLWVIQWNLSLVLELKKYRHCSPEYHPS